MFLSPEVTLYSYKSTIRPCVEFCCHVWAGAPNYYLELFDMLQKQICRTVCPSLAASLEHPDDHRRNVASLSHFYRYYFGRCSSEPAQLVPLPYSHGRSTCYSDKLHDFLSLFLYVTGISLLPVSFLALLDSGILPIECFDLCSTGFMSRINRHFLTVGSF